VPECGSTVLVKPKPTNKLLLGGKEFYLDTRFEETKNAPSCGEVIAVPDKLRFSMVEGQTTLEYDTDIDIKIGDMVIFHYLTEENAQMDGRIMEDGNILIRYDSLFIAKRGDEVICLNDYIIVEPESAVIKTNLEIPDVVSKQKAKQVGIVKYAGTPVRAYRFFPDDYPDPSLQVGDRVVFSDQQRIFMGDIWLDDDRHRNTCCSHASSGEAQSFNEKG